MTEEKSLESKPSWKSKTLWVSFIVAAAAFYPPVGDWITNNTEMFSMVVGGVFAALRVATKGKVTIK